MPDWLGLLIAFTFSGAASRFEDRRHLITDEANAIGTLLLRLDLLPTEALGELRRALAAYVDVRLATHRNRGEAEVEERLWRESAQQQARLWSLAIASVGAPGVPPQSGTLVLGPINEVFDAAGKRRAARDHHPPSVTYAMLALLALAAALLAGLNLGKASPHPRLYMLVFALAISGTFFVTRDIEHPRQGLIRVDDADGPLLEVRDALADSAR